MKKLFFATFFLIVVLITRPVFAEAPRRIISLKPNITEILFELGAGNDVVGVTTYCDYPTKVRKIPKVADYTRPFLERIIALRPDLVIGSEEESSRKSIEEIMRLGIEVKLFSFGSLDEIYRSILGIAEIIGRSETGELVVSNMKMELERLKGKWEGSKKRRVLIVWGRNPLIVGGEKTYLSEILPLIAAENIVKNEKIRYPHWGLEQVIISDPEVIVDLSAGMGESLGQERFWSGLKTLSAVKNKRIYFLDNNLFGRATPRMVESVEMLGGLIHK